MTGPGLFPKMNGTRWGLSVVAIALFAGFPLVYNGQYVLSVMVTTMVLIVLNASWNFSLGVAGVWNFGQLAIYALGGYGAGILMLHAHLPQWICILLGAAFGAFVSVIMALPTLRLFGIYTSLLTFAFAEIVQYAILNDGSGLTGGSYGFPMVNGLFDSMSPEGQMRANYWLVLAVIVVTTISLAAITQSSLGIGLRAARDAPAYAASRGLSPIKMRLAAFAISGFLGGLAGALYLVIEQSISPSAMGLTAMSIDVTMLVIGGLGTNLGPIIGTAIVSIVQALLVTHPGVELTIVGIVLLVVVVFAPGGLVGVGSDLIARVGSWVDEDDIAPGAQDQQPAVVGTTTTGGTDVAE